MKGSNVLAFLGGVLVGGIAALLMAPQSGEETRGQIKDMADEGYNSARRRYGEAREGLRRDAGLRFEVRSGNHTLQVNGVESTTESEFWQGTIVYLQIRTNKEINPAEVVANRTNVAAQYNETFLNDNELEELW